MQAITLAGGWSQTAGLSKARLIRKVPEGHKELMLNLKNVLQGHQSDISVENGDILYVPVSLGKTLAYRGMEAAIAAAQTSVVYAQAIP
jgi:polysaccharide export outer membrane protein